MSFPRFIVAVLIAGLVNGPAAASDSPPLPPGVPPRLTPREEQATFKPAKGLEVQLVAHEPVVQQPLSISFDERGRLWVLQYLQYPIPNGLTAVEVDQYLRTKYDRVPEAPPKGPRGADKITILEDPDGNGVYQKSRDVITGLNCASGFALGYGGVYVVQPPYLLFYKLKPGTDQPDGEPEVLLKGFGMEDAHAFANSLTWGPDGWLYGAQGSTVMANIRNIKFAQGVWRYHPLTREFELFAEGGGNTWGIDFDRHGQLFVGGNTSEPLCHHVQGAYYLKNWAKHGALQNPYAFGYFGAVKHRGFLGSALTGGFVIYQGGLFPERFNNAVLYPNLRVNAMRVSRLEPEGSTFTTNYQEDLVLSSDRWFRPIKSLIGPDGALYVADWYDYNISHSDPKDRSKWYMPSRDTGRLWRIVPAGVKPKARARWPLTKLSSDELIDMLPSPNVWDSREARRILMERRDPSVWSRLEKQALQEADNRLALESLRCLHVSGGLTDDVALKLLAHPSEHVRAWTVRLLGDRRQVAPALVKRFTQLARQEPSRTVRNQLACTCKRLSGPSALPIVEQLLDRAEDVSDPHIPLLLWWAVEDKAISDRARVLRLIDSPDAWNRPITSSTIVERLARRYLGEGLSGGPDGYATCAEILKRAPQSAERERLFRALELQMEGLHLSQSPKELADVLQPLLKADAPSPVLVRIGLRLGFESAYPLAARLVMDPKTPVDERAAFVQTLGELKRPASLPALLGLLGDNEPARVRTAALLALAHFNAPEVAPAVIGRYSLLPGPLQDKARDLLVSRPAWSAAAVSAVEKGIVPAKDFRLEQVRRLFLHKDAALTQRAEKLWGQVRPATSREKQGRILAVSQILAKGPGDANRGKPLAAKLCLNCHQLFGEGQKIGPDLTAVDRKNLEVLLPNIIDPSAIIREGFQQYVVNTADGRILSGLLAENGADRVTILDAKGTRTTLPRKDLEAISRADASLMPEGIIDPLSDQELRDLIAYLRSEPGKEARPPVKTPVKKVNLGSVTEKHVMIPMRDGTRLSAYLYFPPGKGPWPVLYEQRYADLRGAATREAYARLAAAGYVVAAENFRGAQESEGTWVGYRALGWGEKKDGFDTVEWLARQPWSTGKIGTLGSSQAGFAQNFLAVTQPPHLVCQYMIDTGLSLFHEGYRIGGTTRPQRFTQMGAVCRQPEDQRRLLTEWFAHPLYDAYWAEEDCTRHFDKMNVPCFTIGSWFDFMCVGSIDSFIGRQRHGGPHSKGRQQLLLGPWLHGRNKEVNKVGDLTFPENARFPMEAHMIRWFDHYLKGVDNGIEREPAVRYYVMGAVGAKDAPGNAWRTAPDWPVSDANHSWYLGAGGTLTPQVPLEKEGTTSFNADPPHPNKLVGPGFPGAKDARSFEEQAEVRTFTSAVLKEPIEWTGKVRAELFITSDAPDTDVIVRVSDVYPDGRSILLMDYVRRARYREGYEKEVFLEPGKVARVAFDVGWVSQIFARGHRIRITLAGTGAPFYEPNPNTGKALTLEPPEKTQVAHNTVQHSRLYGSRIIAPR